MQDTSNGRMMEIPAKFLEGVPIPIEQRTRELQQLGPEPGLPKPADRGAIFFVGQEVVLYDAGLGSRDPQRRNRRALPHHEARTGPDRPVSAAFAAIERGTRQGS